MALSPEQEKAKEIESAQKYLAAVRQPFEPMVDNIIKYVNHSRRQIAEPRKGDKTGFEVYDGSAMSALNMLVDGMVGYLCSRNIRWFRFAIPNKFNYLPAVGMKNWSGERIDSHPEVARWLQDCEDVQYDAFNRSNFYDVITEFMRDGAGPGTAHILAEEDIGSGRIIFTVPHFRECFIAEDAFGRVDTNYRVYRLTLRQLAQKFGLDRMKDVDRNFINKYEKNPHQEAEIIHAIHPRADYDQGMTRASRKKFASVWLYRAPRKIIEESGYDSMPSITWRWRKNSDEWYGRSPSWDAFIDILSANEQGRSNTLAAQKMVEPPMVAPDDLRGQVNLNPKGWTYLPGDLEARMPRPMLTGIQLPFGLDRQDRTDKMIRDHYAVDFFLMLTMAAANKIELTATQVIEMMGEKAAVLGTRVGMLQSEAFDPIHERVFDIEARAGRMPQPPQILMDLPGWRTSVQYLGPLAQAQLRLSKARSLQGGIALVSQIASIRPEAADVIDWDGVAVDSLDATGFPMNRVRTPEQITAIRQMRMEAMQSQQNIEAMTPMAKMLRAANTKPESGSPAQQLLNPEETAAE